MKYILYAFYFASHFVLSFAGFIYAIHGNTWIGLGIFFFFIIKFVLMMPNVLEQV